jgi:hypothetical protein
MLRPAGFRLGDRVAQLLARGAGAAGRDFFDGLRLFAQIRRHQKFDRVFAGGRCIRYPYHDLKNGPLHGQRSQLRFHSLAKFAGSFFAARAEAGRQRLVL